MNVKKKLAFMTNSEREFVMDRLSQTPVRREFMRQRDFSLYGYGPSRDEVSRLWDLVDEILREAKIMTN